MVSLKDHQRRASAYKDALGLPSLQFLLINIKKKIKEERRVMPLMGEIVPNLLLNVIQDTKKHHEVVMPGGILLKF